MPNDKSEEMTGIETIGARLDGLEALIRKLVKSPFPIAASEAIDQVAMALARAQGLFTNPPKNREVEVQPKKRDDGSWPKPYKFRYSTADVITDMIRKPLCENGLSVLQPPVRTNDGLVIRTILMHESGQWMACELPALMGQKKDAQDQGSAITYARRYSLCALLSIVADEDDDGNAADGNAADGNAADGNAVHGTQEIPPRPVRGARMANATGGMRLKTSKADIQALGNELLEAVRAAEFGDALDALLRDREADFATIKEVSPKGYEALMVNVGKRRAQLANPDSPEADASNEDRAETATHDDNSPDGFDSELFMAGYLSLLAKCASIDAIVELWGFNEVDIYRLTPEHRAELDKATVAHRVAFDPPKPTAAAKTAKAPASVTLDGSTYYDSVAGRNGCAKDIIRMIGDGKTEDDVTAALASRKASLEWLAPGTTQHTAVTKFVAQHRENLRALS